MIRLQKAIMAVGMFSILEAKLQDSLNCKNGFAEIKKILQHENCTSLLEEFIDLELAVNVLKHGHGKSYDRLIAKNGGTLKSYLKQFDEDFVEEHDVSEIFTPIDVDDNFITHCREVIDKVCEVIKKIRPDVIL